jgi:hypothetical protein
MKMHRYVANWWDTDLGGSARVKFASGKVYAVTEETTRHVAQGHAEEVEVSEDVDTAAKKADRARAAADRAVAAAEEARMAAEDAAEAQRIEDEAAAVSAAAADAVQPPAPDPAPLA